MRFSSLIIYVTLFISCSDAFSPTRPIVGKRTKSSSKSLSAQSSSRIKFTTLKSTPGASPTFVTTASQLFMSTTNESAEDNTSENADDDDEIAPGKMRVSEIKAELDMRGISYTDCFDKESLVERLQEARATGRANPEILEKFNKQKLEQTFKEEKLQVKDEEIERMVANDGTLPGGLTPDQFKKLTSNPEIMTLLQSTKMQEAMKLMMTGGRVELEQKLKDDPEMQEVVEKLNNVMGALQ